MKDMYEVIEVQFYKDLKDSEKELEEEKRIVEELMTSNSIEYSLELVQNQKRIDDGCDVIDGYTLNLIIKRSDLHYVLKILDQNKIGFLATKEEINENEIECKNETYEEKEKIKSVDEIERENENAKAFSRLFFTTIFLVILSVEVFIGYWLYCNQLMDYLKCLIILVILQILFFVIFFNSFKRKIEML